MAIRTRGKNGRVVLRRTFVRLGESPPSSHVTPLTVRNGVCDVVGRADD
jgi:hypothetical protein